MRLLAINAGAAYQIEGVEGRYRDLFDTVTRPEELPDVPLDDFDAIIVLCRTPAYRMELHAALLRAYLDGGGTVIAMGESHSERWLPGIVFEPCETNFWWWLDPRGDLGVRVAAPDHPLFQRLGQRDLTWHLHGFFTPPAGAQVLAVGPGDKPILYVDEVSTGGRMVVTSLDPFFHHGHHFMPATTHFLDGFLPWVRDTFTRKSPE
ncbi:MAG: hypothetical protein ABTQ31_03185 [Rhizobiaceae bacterium]